MRCDMAMLLMTDVFAKTWGARAGTAPAEDFWPYTIPKVRERHPDFLFVAEAYWDLEWALQQQGFDHCYDKRLYDRLLHEGADSVRGHLQADVRYQRGLVRFLENHDEPRAAATCRPSENAPRRSPSRPCPARRSGTRGSSRGDGCDRRSSSPVGRRSPSTRNSSRSTTSCSPRSPPPVCAREEWRLLDCTGWPDNPTHENLVAWSWTTDSSRHLVVVNLSDQPAQGRVRLPWTDLRGDSRQLTELLGDLTYDRDGDELVDPGLYVELEGLRWHLVAVLPRS